MAQDDDYHRNSDHLKSAHQEMRELAVKVERDEQSFEHFKKTNRLSPNLSVSEAIEELKKQCQQLEQEADEMEKITSSSRSARKMYGDVTPGDITHQDVICAYQNHFKEANRNLTKQLDVSRQEKIEVWETIATIVRKSFDMNKEHIVERMMEELKKEIEPSIESSQMIVEKRFDFYQAFQLFVTSLEHEDLEQLKLEVLKKIPCQSDEKTIESDIIDFAIDIITQLGPQDYSRFLEEEKDEKD